MRHTVGRFITKETISFECHLTGPPPHHPGHPHPPGPPPPMHIPPPGFFSNRMPGPPIHVRPGKYNGICPHFHFRLFTEPDLFE